VGLDDLDAGRSTTIRNAEEAKIFADKIKQLGREINAKREQDTR
jgi:hypothetical protein